MIRHFSSEIESTVVVPSYPNTEGRRTSPLAKFTSSVFGDKEITDMITKFRPHVVYSDSPLYGSHLKIAQHFGGQRVPTIVHLRGDPWREFSAWIKRSSIKSRLLGSPVFLNNMLGVGLADMITPICRWLEGEVLRHLPSKPTEVVYQGVDPSDFYPSQGLSLLHPAVAIIQNHTVYEKTLGLLRFANVVERMPDVHFYITTGENVRQAFLPLIKLTYSKFKNVHFIADVHYPDGVRRLLTDSDLYVLPSYLDCCPTTILEASLMKKPVLGSRVGGIPEIIVDGYTGWSITNDDTNEWVNKIRMLTDDTKLSRRLGRQGRRWVSDHFGWATIASQVERLIGKISMDGQLA